MYSPAVVLDVRLSNALLAQAVREGFVKLRDPETPVYQDDLRTRATDALLYLLLYDEVYLYANTEHVDLASLASRLPLGEIEPDSYTTVTHKYIATPEGYRDAVAFKPVLLPIVRHLMRGEAIKGLRLTPRSYDAYINAMFRSFNLPGSDALPSMALDDGIIEIWSRIVDVPVDEFRIRLFSNRDAMIEYASMAALKVVPYIHHICDELVDMLGLLKASATCHAVAATSAAVATGKRLGQRITADSVMPPQVQKCFFILLDEVDAFPVAKSLDDILRLREDKRILNFREAMQSWLFELRQGHANAEERMRTAIRAAVADMRRVRQMRRIAGLTTVISLPVAIAEALTGIVGPGYAMTGLSLAAEAYIGRKEWRNSWILVGRAG